jgi:hypothetical protein
MSANNIAQWIAIGMLYVVVAWVWIRMKRLERQLKSARKLIVAEAERRAKHAAAFDKLTDVDSIMEEMERGADIIEARNANRLTKVRLDAGPPAKVYRPKLRSALRSQWNPREP